MQNDFSKQQLFQLRSHQRARDLGLGKFRILVWRSSVRHRRRGRPPRKLNFHPCAGNKVRHSKSLENDYFGKGKSYLCISAQLFYVFQSFCFYVKCPLILSNPQLVLNLQKMHDVTFLFSALPICLFNFKISLTCEKVLILKSHVS